MTVAEGTSINLQLGTKTDPVDDKLDRKIGDTATANNKSKQTKGAMLSTNHSSTLLVLTNTALDTKILTSCHKNSVTPPASWHLVVPYYMSTFWTILTSAAM